ncbi:MAG: precorrin-6y C5,15-methyltransferase (decarboxylating) subunit CbiE, partial [Bacillota bacterium]|nr:precorrin-6y C5,15-methyltransferase (decarboxylating) subunit CbiE [Bacillota bacterium]
MNKLWILGLGPGHKDYILPIVNKKLREADIVVGGKRHLESIEITGIKRKLDIPLYKTIDYLKDNYKDNQIAVVVSGDTGFFSMLDLLKMHFKNEELETYPGISSLQYMFSKLNKSYKNAYIGSVHGRKIDFKNIVNYKIIGLL